MQNRDIAFFVIDYSLGGGVERVTSQLTEMFSKRGIPVTHLISFKKDLERPRMKFPDSIITKVLSGDKRLFSNELENYLKEAGIKTLVFQADNMSFSLDILKAARSAGVRAIAHYHGSPYAYLRKYPDAQRKNLDKILFSKLVYPFKKNKLKRFLSEARDGVVCVGKQSKKELEDLFPGDQYNLIHIPNPSDLTFSDPSSEKENWISFISRLEKKHKNAFLSIRAWELIAKKYPDWQLHIFGDGSLEQEMKDFANTHGITNQVVFRGFEKDIKASLKKSKISISTSNCEGFSMAVLEAIETGNAMAVTKSDGGVSDMVIDLKTGLVSPKNDEQLLAKNIESLIVEENLRQNLALQAQENLREIYGKDIVSLWEEVLFG